MTESDGAISRREFINRIAVLGSLATYYPLVTLAQQRADRQPELPSDWRNEDPWATLAEVQRHLFPASADTPGADDIRALVYLRNTIENLDADGEDRAFVFNGVGWLNDLAQDNTQQPFIVLDEQHRETLLRQIEKSRAGRNWLSLLLTYLLEALLADPVYGGNPNGIGWKWLEHQPGFPTPPEDKTWYRLTAPVRFQRKAT